MKRKTATKLLSCLLSLLMVVGLLSAMGIPAYAAGAAWDADQTFDSDSMIRGGVTVSDNIELTINEGVTVTVYGGIDARGKTLTVSGCWSGSSEKKLICWTFCMEMVARSFGP